MARLTVQLVQKSINCSSVSIVICSWTWAISAFDQKITQCPTRIGSHSASLRKRKLSFEVPCALSGQSGIPFGTRLYFLFQVVKQSDGRRLILKLNLTCLIGLPII